MEREKREIGAVCGRFQIFHKDHLKYVLGAKECCNHLLIGITSSDPSVSLYEENDTNRGTPAANPCTYFERMMIIESALLEVGLTHHEFHIVPFPVSRPELVQYYVPVSATCYFTVYDNWGDEKLKRMREAGYRTEVLWQSEKKGLSSTFIRHRIARGLEWREFVPPAVYTYIKDNKIDDRIKKLMMSEYGEKPT